ncbi:MAG: hypothetical protein EOM31_02655 [Bacteroidia bacterium]|nr:hypothetical protein [Bacteroidia bacterium]
MWGGYYNYPTNQSQVSYYRIDIPAYDDAGKAIPESMGDILRNFLYDIEIQKVSSSGYDTPEDAFEGRVNVDTSIVPWNLATMDEVSFEGIYGLTLSRTVCSYTTTGATNEKLVITTDYNEGWEATFIPAAASSWLKWHSNTPVNDQGRFFGSKGTTTLQFNVSPNQTGESRHAMLKIKVGRLTKFVDFYQTNLAGNVMDWEENENVDFGTGGNASIDGPYRLGVSRTLYDLSKNATAGLELLVSTDFPKGWSTSVVYTTGSDWVTITQNETVDKADSRLIKFSLKENNSLEERSAQLIIKAGNLKKGIRIVQGVNASTTETGHVGPWDEGWKEDEDFGGESGIDGPYKLEVSRTLYTLSKNATTGVQLQIETNHPHGWFTTVEYATGSNWLDITQHGTASGPSKQTLRFNLKENTTLADRHAQLIIQAGNLKKIIHISQDVFASTGGTGNISAWDDQTGWDKATLLDGYYYLSVNQTSYALSKNAQEGLPLAIATDFPKGWSAVIEPASATWATITENHSTSAPGTKLLKFKVSENNSYGDRFARLVVTCGNLKKVIRISQNVFGQSGTNSELTPWDGINGWDKNTLLDEYYFLSVGRAAFFLTKNAQANVPLPLSTDNPNKWNASVTAGSSWLTITNDGVSSSTTSSGITSGILTFSVAENNTANSRSDGEITIRTGNLKKIIRIGQSNYTKNVQDGGIFNWETGSVSGGIGEVKQSLFIDRTTYRLDGLGEKQRSLMVRGAGGGQWQATVLPVQTGEEVSWLTVTTATGIANGANQLATFTVSPYPTEAGTDERRAYLAIRLGNLRKLVRITQYPGAAIQVSEVLTTYSREEAVQTFKLRARAPWRAVVSEDTNGIIRQLRTPSGIATTDETTFGFTLNPDAGTGPLNAKVRLSSINGEFDPYEVTIQTTD